MIPNKIVKAICSGILLLLFLSTGCKKLVEADPPDDWLESGVVFSNDSLAKAALTGLYANIMSQTKYFLNGGMTLFPGLSADELIRTSPLSNEDQFYNNSVASSNPVIGNNFWKAAYSYIYQCNVSIEGLQNSKNISQGLKKQLMGEAKFIRALCYYYLVNLFGEVPLAMTPKADENALLSRAPIEIVINQVKSDLLDADADLTDVIVNTRPNKMACQALLARVYLFNKEWDKAETAATSVINSGRYQLESPQNTFINTSLETILQFAPVIERINSAEGNMFVLAQPAYVITPSLNSSFETNDLRRSYWLDTIEANGNSYIIPFKYKVNNSSQPSEFNVVFRLGEQILIRAEARAHQNEIGTAVEDINIIRTRAALSPLSSSIGQTECLAKIEQERRIELFAEWGHRWFDLKRLGKAHSLLSAKGSTWQITDQLYPIPATEVERDPNLVQNDGY